MADSLDSFFAKKDKSKKGRTKSKFTTSETIAKNLEEGGKKQEVPKREVKEKILLLPPTNNISSVQVPPEQDNDDEWKHIDDDMERDYSGLKVQALTISEKEREDEQAKEQIIDENGDVIKTIECQIGPWKVQNAPSPLPIDPTEDELKSQENEVEDASKSNKVSTYQPPAKRNAALHTPRKLKSAPEIGSDLHFPPLAIGAKEKLSDNDKSFQSVKHGIRSKTDNQNELQLELGNKFAALHHGE